jgi:urease accessory protein
MSPRLPVPLAWIVCGTLGGGLVSGDEYEIDVRVCDGAEALIGSQSTGRLYAAGDGQSIGWKTRLQVSRGATAVLWPDPQTCFADANYRQENEIHLTATSSLIWHDAVTAGRVARDERWAMSSYTNRTQVVMDDRVVIDDRLRLALEPGRNSMNPLRVGAFNHYLTIGLTGPRFDGYGDLVTDLARLTGGMFPKSVQAAVSTVGAVTLLRVGATSPEVAREYLRPLLQRVTSDLGFDFCARRF